MRLEPSLRGEGKRLLLDVMGKKRNDILARIPSEATPPSSFYAFLRQNRKRFFTGCLESLRDAIESEDTTDFMGNETFQSYSHAKHGYTLKEVLQVNVVVKNAVIDLISEMLDCGEADSDAAFGAVVILEEIMEQASLIRAQAFTQTRDETIRFYQACQEEIDNFPENLAATLDWNTLLKSAVKKCLDLTGSDRCAVLTRDLLTSELHLQASSFDHEQVLGGTSFQLDEPITKRLVHRHEPVLVEGQRRSLPLTTAVMRKMRTKVLLLVPMLVRGRNVGVIMMDSQERPQMFTPETINLAVRFANRVAAAMENARLHGSEQRKLKETMALLEVSRLVTSTLEIETLLDRLVQITADICEVEKCSVYLYVEDDDRFYPTATYGKFEDSDWETTMGEGVSAADLLDEEAERLMERHQAVVSDAQLSPFMPAERIEDTGISSVLTVPMFSREKILGIVVLFHEKEAYELDTEDMGLVNAIAGQAAVALENATLYENLEVSYFSTVKALARAIEVKDPYTHGHSERVTKYAIAIARRLGVSDREKRNLKYAGALHDIGKIGIAGRVLEKPGRLSEEEFLHIQTHPQLGDSIIEPVDFLKEPRSIILHHHERYDGKGYPAGLKGEEIPLGARILAVADAFEAMMSDRPYRKALKLEKAIIELQANAGTQFDPGVVDAFLSVIGEEGVRKGGEDRIEGLLVRKKVRER